MTADPNMKCVCGFRRFRESVDVRDEEVEQWLRYDDSVYGGFGSTPFGTYFGSGSGGASAWGLFILTVARTHKVLACESCARARSDKVIGGNGVFGSYLLGDSIFVLVSDATLLGCLRVRFTNAEFGITIDVSPTVYGGTALPLAAEEPETTAATPPAGATIAGLLRARLPDVDHDGEFVVSLVDVCANTETLLTTLPLESAVQVHPPSEADLGMPPHVVRQGLRVEMPAAQPGSGSMYGIPFDFCRTVIEYDARFGELPADDGWTEVGTPTTALEPGGVLVVQTTTTALYLKEVTIPTAFTQVYMYSQFWVEQSDTGVADDGFYVQGDGAPGASGDYLGMLIRGRTTGLSTKTLNGSSVNTVQANHPPGWMNVLTGMDPGVANGFAATPLAYAVMDHASTWGDGDAGGVNPTLRAAFGDFEGSNCVAHIRNLVVSEPGRFMRAFFRSYAAAAAQTLRLYFVSDVDGVATPARVRVRYGNLGLGVDPYDLASASIADATAYFTTRNSMVEVTLSLTGLEAQQPFWFSVERLWDHADDLTQATIHLVNSTVRSS